MKKRNLKGNNKGFTLVELIVVLVILAILAAILVPALLGYIDQARNKQTLLNARSAMTAAQAELSAIYGSATAEPGDIAKTDNAHYTNLVNTADFKNLAPYPTNFIVGVGEEYKTGDDKKVKHAAFTVNYVVYRDESGSIVQYLNGDWTELEELPDADTKPDGVKATFNVDIPSKSTTPSTGGDEG